jgi:hypothetical protein
MSTSVTKQKESNKGFKYRQEYYQKNKEKFKEYYQQNKERIDEKRRLRRQEKRKQKEQELKDQLTNIEKRKLRGQENKDVINEKRRLKNQMKKDGVVTTNPTPIKRGRPSTKAVVSNVDKDVAVLPAEPNIRTHIVPVGTEVDNSNQPYSFWTFVRDLFKKETPTPKLNLLKGVDLYMMQSREYKYDTRRDVCSETISYLMTTNHKEENLEYVQELIERLTIMRQSL